jgi:bifunctional UDP-N-acetylglucosamine pyrophosphorylase/glucosamine-1-phosphate N-acetyltransferase
VDPSRPLDLDSGLDPVADADAGVEDGTLAAVVVLAAGGGTRMKSGRSKLLHEVAGHSLLSYVLDAATGVGPEHVVVVVGHAREQVEAHLAEIAPHVTVVAQGEAAYGSGYAAQCALEQLPDLQGEVLVTVADVPLLTGETLAGLVAEHRRQRAAATVLTSRVPNPTGYGRIVRDDDGQVSAIVEHKDASLDQLEIDEINSGIYVFDAEVLRLGLREITADNAQRELMLTDVVGVARGLGETISAHLIDDLWQTEGVNDRVQLSRLGHEMNRRILDRWMRAGVTIVDPATTWVHASVDLAPDVTLLPGTSLEGATSVKSGAVIGPDTTLVDVEVDERAIVCRTQASLSVIGPDANVGPFAYLRPGTVLGARGKIGTFVETKNARIGTAGKVPHLTYAGDVVIGDGANIGAGTIFANYDGVTKSTSHVGRSSFIGSNSVLVAPVTLGDGSYIAAGSTVVGDVGPGQLAVARGQQRNINGWVARKRAGTRSAQAAAEALNAAAADAGAGADQGAPAADAGADLGAPAAEDRGTSEEQSS